MRVPVAFTCRATASLLLATDPELTQSAAQWGTELTTDARILLKPTLTSPDIPNAPPGSITASPTHGTPDEPFELLSTQDTPDGTTPVRWPSCLPMEIAIYATDPQLIADTKWAAQRFAAATSLEITVSEAATSTPPAGMIPGTVPGYWSDKEKYCDSDGAIGCAETRPSRENESRYSPAATSPSAPECLNRNAERFCCMNLPTSSDSTRLMTPARS